MEIKGKALKIKTIKTALKNSYGNNKKKEGFDGYEPVDALTDTESQVYYNPETKQAIVTHRGTQSLGDVFQDYTFATRGYKGRRFKKADKVQKEAERLYGANNVTTLGHSLGSLISSEVGKNSKEIINYNKPIVPFYGKKQENEYNIKTSNDPFSWFYKKKEDDKNKTIASNTYNPVTEHSITKLDELDPDEMIGKGLKVKEMKEMIKLYNKGIKTNKIKYGKMKKKELQNTIILLKQRNVPIL